MVIDRAQENRGNHTLRVVGRLRRGVTLEQARDEMRAVAAAMEQEFPATNTNWGVRIDALSDTMLDPQVRRSLLLMLGAVTIVFLIACANVANLLLARGTRASGGARTAHGARSRTLTAGPPAADRERLPRSRSAARQVYSWPRSRTR